MYIKWVDSGVCVCDIMQIVWPVSYVFTRSYVASGRLAVRTCIISTCYRRLWRRASQFNPCSLSISQ